MKWGFSMNATKAKGTKTKRKVEYVFTATPTVILYDAEINAEAKTVLFYLYDKAGGKGYSYVKQKKIAEALGLTYDHTKDLIAHLKGMDLIWIKRRRGTAITYLRPLTHCYTDPDDRGSPITEECRKTRNKWWNKCKKPVPHGAKRSVDDTVRSGSNAPFRSGSSTPSRSGFNALSRSGFNDPYIEQDKGEQDSLEQKTDSTSLLPCRIGTEQPGEDLTNSPPGKGSSGTDFFSEDFAGHTQVDSAPIEEDEDVRNHQNNPLDKKAGGVKRTPKEEREAMTSTDPEGESKAKGKGKGKGENKNPYSGEIKKLWDEWKKLNRNLLNNNEFPAGRPRGQYYGHLKNIIQFVEGDFDKALKILMKLIQNWDGVKASCSMAKNRPFPDLYIADTLKDQLYGCVMTGKSFGDHEKDTMHSRDRFKKEKDYSSWEK
jgi:hypothetical protein